MKAMIFGSGGQDGFYLSRLLEQKNIQVIGVDKSPGQVSITDTEGIRAFIHSHQPSFIFHLAAHSTTRHDAWKENHETICTGTLNILEAARSSLQPAKVFISGSGLQFENTGLPIKETDPFAASSLYAVSRIQSVYAARYYRSIGLPVYAGYFFNHDSPYRDEKHINKKIMETARRIAAGTKEKLSVGDLSAEKEFGFAGDIVEGIWTLVSQDHVYEAVIGTGIAHSIAEWVKICFDLFGLNWEDHVVPDPGFIPPYKRLVADPATIISLGWRPKTSIHQLAEKMKG